MNKLEKFAAMKTYENVFEPKIERTFYQEGGGKHVLEDLMARVGERRLCLELGCGRGEYTVALAREDKTTFYVGVDIKGARMYMGATEAIETGVENCAFLRTRIELIDVFFPEESVDEVWITFPDPQMSNARKRLTSTYFMKRYARFLKKGAQVHLKTDSNFLFTYTCEMLKANGIDALAKTSDLYGEGERADLPRSLRTIQTAYERQWLSRGLTIKYLSFVAPVGADALEEPNVEIELDAYRSYGKTQNSTLKKHA